MANFDYDMERLIDTINLAERYKKQLDRDLASVYRDKPMLELGVSNVFRLIDDLVQQVMGANGWTTLDNLL